MTIFPSIIVPIYFKKRKEEDSDDNGYTYDKELVFGISDEKEVEMELQNIDFFEIDSIQPLADGCVLYNSGGAWRTPASAVEMRSAIATVVGVMYGVDASPIEATQTEKSADTE